MAFASECYRLSELGAQGRSSLLIMNNNIIIRRYFGSINEDSKEEKEFYLYYMASSDNYEFATKIHAYVIFSLWQSDRRTPRLLYVRYQKSLEFCIFYPLKIRKRS